MQSATQVSPDVADHGTTRSHAPGPRSWASLSTGPDPVRLCLEVCEEALVPRCPHSPSATGGDTGSSSVAATIPSSGWSGRRRRDSRRAARVRGDAGADLVSVIETVTNTVIAQMPGLPQPVEAAASVREVYVAHYRAGDGVWAWVWAWAWARQASPASS